MTQAMTPEQVVERLDGMGYFRWTPASEVSLARSELTAMLAVGGLGTGWDDEGICRDRRGYSTDSEELAEGREGEFMLLMGEVLRREGVRFRSITDDFAEDEYAVVIDGQRHVIHDASVPPEWDHWILSTKRFLEIVNGLLEEAGSPERLYGLAGGNDTRVVLLTDEMHELGMSCGLIRDRAERPYPASALVPG